MAYPKCERCGSSSNQINSSHSHYECHLNLVRQAEMAEGTRKQLLRKTIENEQVIEHLAKSLRELAQVRLAG